MLCMGIGSTVECSFTTLALCFSLLAHPCNYYVNSWKTPSTDIQTYMYQSLHVQCRQRVQDNFCSHSIATFYVDLIIHPTVRPPTDVTCTHLSSSIIQGDLPWECPSAWFIPVCGLARYKTRGTSCLLKLSIQFTICP